MWNSIFDFVTNFEISSCYRCVFQRLPLEFFREMAAQKTRLTLFRDRHDKMVYTHLSSNINGAAMFTLLCNICEFHRRAVQYSKQTSAINYTLHRILYVWCLLLRVMFGKQHNSCRLNCRLALLIYWQWMAAFAAIRPLIKSLMCHRNWRLLVDGRDVDQQGLLCLLCWLKRGRDAHPTGRQT